MTSRARACGHESVSCNDRTTNNSISHIARQVRVPPDHHHAVDITVYSSHGFRSFSTQFRLESFRSFLAVQTQDMQTSLTGDKTTTTAELLSGHKIKF